MNFICVIIDHSLEFLVVKTNIVDSEFTYEQLKSKQQKIKSYLNYKRIHTVLADTSHYISMDSRIEMELP